MTASPVAGAGLGLRRSLLPELADLEEGAVDFVELAPENWIGVGGRFGRQLRAVAEKFPLVCHGLSLSLGGPAPLDTELLGAIRSFLDLHRVRCYTEHLSYCSDDRGHLYDLMPIPFTDEAVRYVAARIRQTQEILERRVAVENVSYYAAPGQELSEVDFVNAVLHEADCDLLLDVNNVYVNSVNFRYDPVDFLRRIDGARTVYLHVAGHYVAAPDLRVDTHGAAVIDPVWDLLGDAFDLYGPRPTVLERDFDFPPLDELLAEVNRIRALQSTVRSHAAAG